MRRHSHKNKLAYEGGVKQFFMIIRDDGDGSLHQIVEVVGGVVRDLGIRMNTLLSMFEGDYLEVTEADLPYLKKPDGDWKFRKPVLGEDTFRTIFGNDCPSIKHGTIVNASVMEGYRWCKVKKAGTVATDTPTMAKIRDILYHSGSLVLKCSTAGEEIGSININDLRGCVVIKEALLDLAQKKDNP